MNEYNMDEIIRIDLSGIGNCRKQFYDEEEISQKINKRKIAGYLRKLKESGDDYKIKNIKKLYQIYTIFYQIKSLIFSKDTFEYTEKDLSINDFTDFLVYIIDCTKADIIEFIDRFQDDNFDNEVLMRENLEENRKRFCAYLKFKHFTN